MDYFRSIILTITMQLFTSGPQLSSANDPWMVSPKGIKVQVLESRVPELLAKGFILIDKDWKPALTKTVQELVERTVPLTRQELNERVSSVEDLLDCEEI